MPGLKISQALEKPLVVYESGSEDTERPSRSPRRFFQILIASVLVLNSFLWLITQNWSTKLRNSSQNSKSCGSLDQWTPFYWNTEYSPKGSNHTESDALWEQIKPSHGFIAVDRQRAAEDHWPVSMYLPSDHSKGVYLLEAYHQLHCIRIIRKTFWQAIEGKPFTYPPSHSNHCFDALRQAVVCNADDTPLYTFGDFTAGDGQVHKCRDWRELREYATQHTACYRDSVEHIPLGDHFGFCDGGDDGIVTDLDV